MHIMSLTNFKLFTFAKGIITNILNFTYLQFFLQLEANKVHICVLLKSTTIQHSVQNNMTTVAR